MVMLNSKLCILFVVYNILFFVKEFLILVFVIFILKM